MYDFRASSFDDMKKEKTETQNIIFIVHIQWLYMLMSFNTKHEARLLLLNCLSSSFHTCKKCLLRPEKWGKALKEGEGGTIFYGYKLKTKGSKKKQVLSSEIGRKFYGMSIRKILKASRWASRRMKKWKLGRFYTPGSLL